MWAQYLYIHARHTQNSIVLVTQILGQSKILIYLLDYMVPAMSKVLLSKASLMMFYICCTQNGYLQRAMNMKKAYLQKTNVE